jgi:hypothetical protein
VKTEDRATIAKTLRELADAIERGDDDLDFFELSHEIVSLPGRWDGEQFAIRVHRAVPSKGTP